MSDERPKRMSDEGFEATVNRLADIPLPGGVSVAGVSPSDVLLHFTLEARRARASEKRLEEALAKMHSEVEDWIHTEDCSRTNDCDLAGPCDGDSEPCPAPDPHVWCDYHGHEACPDCECGKAPLLKMIFAALSEVES